MSAQRNPPDEELRLKCVELAIQAGRDPVKEGRMIYDFVTAETDRPLDGSESVLFHPLGGGEPRLVRVFKQSTPQQGRT